MRPDPTPLASPGWIAADLLARHAEIELCAVWVRFANGRGPAPTGALVARVQALRREAGRKLSTAMSATGSQADLA